MHNKENIYNPKRQKLAQIYKTKELSDLVFPPRRCQKKIRLLIILDSLSSPGMAQSVNVSYVSDKTCSLGSGPFKLFYQIRHFTFAGQVL